MSAVLLRGFSSLRRFVGRLRVLRVHVFLLYLAIAAGSLLRVREAFVHNPMDQLFSDPLRHWTFAHETLSTQPWALIDPPFFQMWLSLVQKWSLGVPLLVAVYAGLLSAATPWLWYGFLRESLRSRTLALLGWALLAWLPSWIAIFRYFMTETLFLPLMGASLWETMRADRKRTAQAFSWMVILWTLTGLTRGIALPFAGLSGLWVWLRQSNKLRNMGLAILIGLSMTVPIAVRNHHFLNLWSPFGTGWPNQIYAASGAHDIHLHLVREGDTAYYEFGSPSMYAKQLAPLSDWEPRRSGVVNVTADLRKGAEDWQAAYDSNAAHGWRAVRLRWENLVLVMLGESWPDNNRDNPIALAAWSMRWVWAPLAALLMIGVAVRRRAAFSRPLVPALIGAWFLFQGVSLLAINEGRYRKPLEGLLISQLLLLFDGARPASRRPT
jgi:hypothetical protein